ncbi:MAG TPA: S41 family peptidase [Rhizomicrobium sp.]|nr:S41 family peptidase [Rhizomicrobium sp.]
MKRYGFTAAGVAIGFVAGLVVLAKADTAPDSESAYHALDRFGQAFSVVRADYVDPPEDKQLVENALAGMIGSLDPHSSYFDPKTYSDMQVRTEGQYGGVGIVIAVEAGAVKVVSPIDDTPAAAAGVKSGDVILAVDGKGLQGLSLDQVQLLLRGKAGTKVTLSLMRQGADKSFDVTLTRAFIEVEAVKYHREGDVGYIRIPAFNEHTDTGLQTAVRSLKKQIGPKLKGYIVDLRDDGGGVLDQAIAVSDDFLEGGEIVSTRGRDPSDTQRYDAKPGDITDGKPIVVLINRGTASASEIVAGALQDHKRARIVGMTSFGKGSVQTIIPLNGGDDGALHLTTARYYTPSGRSIQATGIVPDIAVAQGDETATSPVESYTEADLPHHLVGETTVKGSDVAPIRPPAGKKVDDFQLSYAVDLLDGRVGPKTVAERKE